MKTYNIRNNVGKAKYLFSFHNGFKTHKDNSPFFDIEIFKNKRDLALFVRNLKGTGYINE